MQLLKNLILAGATVCLCILCIDTGMRMSGIQAVNLRPLLHQPSTVPSLEYELRPSMTGRGFRGESVRTDSRGFRSQEIDETKPTIAILGDSYAFGFGVKDEETNAAHIQAAFPQYNVINTGVNGYNIEQEYLTFVAKVQHVKPSVIILQFTPNDADRKAFYAQDISAKISSDSSGWNIRGPRWWWRTSPLVDTTKRAIKNMRVPAMSERFTVEWSTEWLNRYEAWLRKLSDATGKTPKLLVLWPDAAERPETFRAIRSMGEKLGWQVLDLHVTLGTRFDRLSWDSHPSALTQKKAAEEIIDVLRRMEPSW